jgi:hypothetical protein
MRNFVIGKLMGRCGNQFYQIATTYAYARKHDFDFFVSSGASNCFNNATYFNNLPTKDISRNSYTEPRDSNNNSYFHEIPKIEDVYLMGYWQSFEYFNDYREEILNLLNMPYEFKEGYISLHVRRGDFLENKNNECIMPLHYYSKCIEFSQIGGKKFKYLVFSDDIEWCKSIFNKENFGDTEFEFSEGRNELDDLSLMSSCEHNICANSTFSYTASWLNRNENKLVFTPDINNMFGGCNLNMIPDNYIKIKI